MLKRSSALMNSIHSSCAEARTGKEIRTAAMNTDMRRMNFVLPAWRRRPNMPENAIVRQQRQVAIIARHEALHTSSYRVFCPARGCDAFWPVGTIDGQGAAPPAADLHPPYARLSVEPGAWEVDRGLPARPRRRHRGADRGHDPAAAARRRYRQSPDRPRGARPPEPI